MSAKSSLKQVMNNQLIISTFPLVKIDLLQGVGGVDHGYLDQRTISREVKVMCDSLHE